MSRDRYTVEAFKEVHGETYLYDEYVYIGSEKKSTIICREHGRFQQSPRTHLRGSGCPSCGNKKTADSMRMSQESFIEECVAIHGSRYNYEKTCYTSARGVVTITCKIHGDFSQVAYSHKLGKGCPKCGRDATAAAKTGSTEGFVRKAVEKHGSVFNYNKVRYKTNKTKVEIECPLGHTFLQTPSNHLSGCGCPVCQVSPLQMHLYSKLGGELNNRSILKNGQEIDLYFDKEKIGIEVNGVYFHSEKFVPKRYHQDKTEDARSKGIQLFHIWYERGANHDLVLSWARAKLGRIENNIYARKCTVVSLDSKTYNNFLLRTHLQGSCKSKVRFGLVYNDNLISVAGFSMIGGVWSLDRFSSELDTVVVGGFSKLLSKFLGEFRPARIVTFSDMAYSNGNVYLKNGFEKTAASNQPRRYYTNGYVLKDRRRFQRAKIKRRRPDIRWASEREMAAEEGYTMLWGCNTERWEFVPRNMV